MKVICKYLVSRGNKVEEESIVVDMPALLPPGTEFTHKNNKWTRVFTIRRYECSLKQDDIRKFSISEYTAQVDIREYVTL